MSMSPSMGSSHCRSLRDSILMAVFSRVPAMIIPAIVSGWGWRLVSFRRGLNIWSCVACIVFGWPDTREMIALRKAIVPCSFLVFGLWLYSVRCDAVRLSMREDIWCGVSFLSHSCCVGAGSSGRFS